LAKFWDKVLILGFRWSIYVESASSMDDIISRCPTLDSPVSPESGKSGNMGYGDVLNSHLQLKSDAPLPKTLVFMTGISPFFEPKNIEKNSKVKLI
jgi:hypothetical protein